MSWPLLTELSYFSKILLNNMIFIINNNILILGIYTYFHFYNEIYTRGLHLALIKIHKGKIFNNIIS